MRLLLGSPFTERCFQLAEKDGYFGIITSNNFMKRTFGKPLIEVVLRNIDLTLLVDTSQAFIPHHGTPTVLFFARNRRPSAQRVCAVMGKRGETSVPEDPKKGRVWSSVVEGWSQVGFENEYVSVADLPRETLDRHPWSLGGGGAAELRQRLELNAPSRLAKVIDLPIGRGARSGADDIFALPTSVVNRMDCDSKWWRPVITGDIVRDWSTEELEQIFFPYDEENGLAARTSEDLRKSGPMRHLWPFRTFLAARATFQGVMKDAGLQWFEYMQYTASANLTPRSLVFSFVATHNHFAFVCGGSVFNRSAPVIKLPREASDEDHFALLGLLNSSTACFWMKQIFHDKGGATDKGKWQADPAKIAYEFAGKGMQELPLPDFGESRHKLISYARGLDRLASERTKTLVNVLPEMDALVPLPPSEIRANLADAEAREKLLLRSQIALQEELDWLVYALYGLVDGLPSLTVEAIERSAGVPLGARPFEILQAQGGREFGVDGQVLMNSLPTDMDQKLSEVWMIRVNAIERSPSLALIEHENYKRRWLLTPKHLAGRVETFADRLADRLRFLLGNLLEFAVRKRSGLFDLARIAADLQEDARFAMLAELMTGRRDYSHDQLVLELLTDDAVPSHPLHRYSKAGLVKRRAWEQTWEDQRREDAGEKVTPAVPPSYSQPDFATRRIFELRGKLDVPRERYIAFTEVPGRTGTETLYGWAGWTPLQRIKAILAVDEDLDDSGVALADRVGLLDSAWRLLPDLAREDAPAASRLKAELQALVGPTGPSREMLEDWGRRFPPPKAPKKTTERARKPARAEEDDG